MQTSPQDMLGTPRSESIDDREFLLYPFTVDEYLAWDEWARKEFLKSSAIESADEPESTKRAWRDSMARSSFTISFGAAPAFNIMYSAGGMIHALWLSMRRGKPGYTRVQAWKDIMGPNPSPKSFEGLTKLFESLLIVCGLVPVTPDPTGAAQLPLVLK